MARTQLEEIIWQRDHPDPEEFALLMETSEKLKGEADLRRGPSGERPATVKQVVAAALLEYDLAVTLPLDKLRLFCSAYTRGQVSEMLPARHIMTPVEQVAREEVRPLGERHSNAGKACPCGKPAYTRGLCVNCYRSWYRRQRRAEDKKGLTTPAERLQ